MFTGCHPPLADCFTSLGLGTLYCSFNASGIHGQENLLIHDMVRGGYIVRGAAGMVYDADTLTANFFGTPYQ
jgi:hypothetical protein